MPNAIKLMPDYDCHPLWGMDPENIGNIDPSTLPISDGLKGDLNAWADKFDATLNRQDPLSSGFAHESVERAFDSDGRGLWRRLSKELGESYLVKYFSILENRILESEG